MGDNIAIDWSAGANMNPQGALGVVNQGYAGAEEGYKLGQARAMIHALQGVDLNSPQSVDAGIGNLVRANAGEQANALQNLSFTRTLRSAIPGLLNSLTGAKEESSQPPAQPSVDPQHAIETFSLAKKAADTLADTPEEDRPAAFQTLKADLLKRGIPAEAIDSAGQHLAGDGPKQLSDYYSGLLAHAQHQMSPEPGAEAPAVPAPHPSSAWYNTVTDSPRVPLAVAMMKGAGLDLTPYLDTAKALALPGVTEAARAGYAGQIARDTASAQKGVDIAAGPVMAVIEAFKAGKIKEAELGPAIRLAQAQADITAGHTLTESPEVDAQGNPTGRMVQKTVAGAINATGGAHPPVKQSAAEAGGQTDDAHIFMSRYKDEANQGAIQADINARDQSIAAAHMAQTLNPSNLTPWIAKNANTLNGLGIKIAAKDANQLSTYQTLVAQNLKSAIQVYPRNMGEFHAIQNAVADAKSPGDAAALALTETAAIRDQAAQQKQFRIDYAAQHPGEYSERAFQTAWAAQPGANQSVFASPLFRDLKVNGKPAVTVYPQPYKDGHTYGVFMPGTPQKTVFRVR